MKTYERYSRILPWLMALLLSALVVACGGGRDPILGSPELGSPAVVSIAVTPATASIPPNGTQAFVATATYSDGSTHDVTATSNWSSGSTSVASVNATSGVATGLVSGTALITATLGGKTSAANLTVTATTLTAITVTPATATVQVGLTQPFVATGTYSDGSSANISTTVAWTSGSPTVAGVNASSGLATGVSAGSATITATSGGKTGSAALTVTTIPVVPPTVNLGSASTFGTFGGSAGMTSSGLLTVINGNIGTTAVSTAVTGFHDAGPGCTYTETPLNNGVVNGLIYTAAPPPTVACPTEGTATTFAIALAARADALAAYNALVAMPVGADPGANLAGKTLAPGVYTSPSGSFMIQGGDLTLDAQGNANAVWVFQMATTLTVGGPGAAAPQSIILAGGAQAKNVFWQVGSAATINAGGGGTMVGTIISQAGAAFSTAGNVAIVTLNGRVLSLGASVTLVNTVINVP